MSHGTHARARAGHDGIWGALELASIVLCCAVMDSRSIPCMLVALAACDPVPAAEWNEGVAFRSAASATNSGEDPTAEGGESTGGPEPEPCTPISGPPALWHDVVFVVGDDYDIAAYDGTTGLLLD